MTEIFLDSELEIFVVVVISRFKDDHWSTSEI